MVAFSEQIWLEQRDSVARLLEHPFVTELGNGSLDKAAFRRYVLQDSLYLCAYKKALEHLADRAPDTAAKRVLRLHVLAGVESERESRLLFASALGLSHSDISGASPCEAVAAYADFLSVTSVVQPFGVGLAAMLPCYRSYRDIARRLSLSTCPDPLYLRWIGLYVGPEYEKAVSEICGLLDRAAEAEAAQIPLMAQAVERGLRLEHDFFDCVWRGK